MRAPTTWRITRLSFLLGFAATSLGLSIAAAEAHDPYSYFDKVYSGDVQLKYGEVNGVPRSLVAGTLSDVRDVVNAVSGSTFDFSAVVSVTQQTPASSCDLPTNHAYAFVSYIDGGGGTTGLSSGCVNSQNILRSKAVIDSGENNHWYSTHPASNQIDARSTLLHEMTHSIGFDGHITGSGCPSSTDMHVMCPGAVRGEDWKRDYQYHDNETLQAMY